MLIGALSFFGVRIEEALPILSTFSRFIIAILIIIVGFMAGRAAGNLASNAIQRLKLNGKGKKKRRVDMVVGSTIKYLIYILALILALNQIGVALNFLNQILTILLVIVAVGLFLSIKDFVPNAVAGAYIIYKKRLKVGQTIKVKDVEGKIKKIDLIDTHIRTKNGHDIMIPNSFFVKNLVVKKK